MPQKQTQLKFDATPETPNFNETPKGRRTKQQVWGKRGYALVAEVSFERSWRTARV
jgi:hypothetical protein